MADTTGWRFRPRDGRTFPVRVTDEIHTVEFHSAWQSYGIQLKQGPALTDTGITDPIMQIVENDSAEAPFEERPRNTPPGVGQYVVDYDAETYQGTGRIEFNSADAGTSVKVTYWGKGQIMSFENFLEYLAATYNLSVIKDVNQTSNFRGANGRANEVPLLADTLGLDFSLKNKSQTITVGTAPNGILVDRDYIWVANETSNNVSKIDRSSNAVVNTIAVGTTPAFLTSDGTYIWVGNQGSTDVSKIDPASDTVVDTVSVTDNALGIVHIDGYIYVACFNASSGFISKIEAATGTYIGDITVNAGATFLAYDGEFLWVTERSNDSVSKINLSTGATVVTIALAGGYAPYGITFDGIHMWVTSAGSVNIYKINTLTHAIDSTIVSGFASVTSCFDGKYIWTSGSTIQQIDVNDEAVVNTFASGGGVGAAYDGTHTWFSAGGVTTEITRYIA